MGYADPERRRAYQRAYYRRREQQERRSAYARSVRRDPEKSEIHRNMLRLNQKYKRTRRQRVFERDGGRCHYCQMPLDSQSFAMDHRVPLRDRGPTVLENLVASCQPCNSKKNYRHSYEQFMALMRPDWTPPWVEGGGETSNGDGQLGD